MSDEARPVPRRLTGTVKNRWEWKEEDRDPPLAFGDAYLEGAFLAWPASTALAHNDGIMQVGGLELDRRGRMRARNVFFRMPWSQVTTFWRTEIVVPSEVTRFRSTEYVGARDAIALRVTGFGPPADAVTLMVLQNLDHWAEACRVHKVAEDTDA